MSKRLLAKIDMNCAEYRIIYENRPRNPYRITRRWWDIGKNGWKTETKVRFADYLSCLYWIAEEANLYGRNHITG